MSDRVFSFSKDKLVLALVFLCASGCPPPEAEVPLAGPSTAFCPVPVAIQAAPAPSAAGRPELRVLYRDDWFGGTTLLGVDAKGPRAIVRLESENPKRLAIDIIDLAHGSRIERWDVKDETTRAALLGRGFALSSSPSDALLKFARIVASLGPWHMRASLPAPTFAVSPDSTSILFGSPPADGRDGDWLMAVDREGKNPRRVDEGLRASYSPIFAPDGSHFAFRGCTSSPCDYGLFVAQLGQKPRRVGGVAGSSPPVFSRSGESLYAIGDSTTKRATRCLYKALVGGVGSPQPITCVTGLEDVAFVEDPDGRTGVLSGVRGVPGQQEVDLKWVLLEDGAVLQEHTVARAVGGGIMNGAGLLALPMQKGALSFVDLVNDKRVLVPDSEGWFFGFDATRWLGDSLVLMRKPEGTKGYELVGIDARALLKQQK